MLHNVVEINVIDFTLCNLHGEISDILQAVLTKPKVTTCNPFYRGGYTRQAIVGSSSSSSYNDDLDGILRFYEWSDLNRRPRIFQSMSRFLAFLGCSNIPISEVEKKALLAMRSPYVTCVRGKRELLVRSNVTELRVALDSMEKKSSIESEKHIEGYGGVILPGIKNLICDSGQESDKKESFGVRSYEEGGKNYPALCPSVPNKPYNGEYVGQWFG